jgi:hypothetical protein
MLRRVVQLIAGLFVLIGLYLTVAGASAPGVKVLLLGLVVLVAVRFERWRARPLPPPSGPHWQPTGERFEDPGSGKTVEVHYNPATGERRYRPDGEG